MEISVVGALSGVLGSLVGGAATVGTAWITQQSHSRREMVRVDVAKREALYGEFISECGRLLMDALTHTLEEPQTLLPAYALLNRIRLTASSEVLAEAERLLLRITDQYFASNVTLEEVGRIARSVEVDPLKTFGETCRAELQALQALV